MLSAILSKSQCANCGFCCVFRWQSRWETPLFSKENADAISQRYSRAKFRPVGDMLTIDIDGEYKTDSAEEEAACFFLDKNKGCTLTDDEKPIDCKIWPLRIMNKSGKLVIALTPTCAEINKLPVEEVRDLVHSGLGQIIKDEAAKYPDMIKEYRDGFPVLMEFND